MGDSTKRLSDDYDSYCDLCELAGVQPVQWGEGYIAHEYELKSKLKVYKNYMGEWVSDDELRYADE